MAVSQGEPCTAACYALREESAHQVAAITGEYRPPRTGLRCDGMCIRPHAREKTGSPVRTVVTVIPEAEIVCKHCEGTGRTPGYDPGEVHNCKDDYPCEDGCPYNGMSRQEIAERDLERSRAEYQAITGEIAAERRGEL